MATDDERREIADKFRTFDYLEAVRIGLARGSVATGTLQVLGAITGVDMTSSVECVGLFDRLADLIEPSCDRDALMEMADELTADAMPVPAVYGSYQSGYVAACRDVARRIREALGVSE